ncbi:replicative DNA helicase [Micromonospora sp. NPDC023633]|uniref:replicative DNA helicase n=1 Tax=Micromonospora sp. NPDC023633 TaxID=3154320 RepID=UPI0033DDBDAE
MEGGPVSVTDDMRADSRSGGGQASPPPQRDGQFDKTPPQDVAAEQCVLGGMLLSKDAIADVVEILKTNDFYRPVHATIFDTILEIYGRGEPADSITVAAALADSGDLVRIGGAPYLHTLIASVPTAANAAYYARIVSERAVLRRLVEAGTKIVQLGYGTGQGGSRDVDDIVDLAQQAVYDVTERRVSEDFAVLADMLQPTLDEIEAVGAQGGVMTGVPTGFTDLDRLLNGLHAGQLVIVAGRPGLGKSTASMDFARNAAIRANQASAIFSLEMSKVEIVMRLLSAEARVPLHVLRSGQLSDDDWTKLARCMGEISEAPLFVDDTPSMNLMEIRAKARRLKQRHDLKLIVVDYLQLMTSPKRTESRQQEVADLSRGLKLLAKEVECPVIAVSQLNRGPEQRTDKRPQLSDLRESGCLTAETRLIRADDNSEVTLGELLAAGAEEVPVWALDESLRYAPRTMTHVFPSGHREVFRMKLASGKQIDATTNHPFLTFTGWVPLGELMPGTRLATPRHIPPPLAVRPWAEAEVVLLAHLLGDGSFVRRQPIRYASRDEQNLQAVAEAAKHFGITAVRDDYEAARVTTLRLPAPYRLARGRRNPVAEWLDGLGLFGLRSHEKFIPASVFSMPKEQITLFLRHLWATDGSVTVNKSGRGGRVYFSSTSRRMLEDISRLLLRYGISARLKLVRVHGYRPQYTLDVSGRDDQLRFLREIGVHGDRARNCADLLASLATIGSNTNVDTVPREVWGRVREILAETGTTHREFAAAIDTKFCGSALWKHAPSRSRLAKVASVLDAADLDLHATNDIFWDEIVSIESVGERDVFDATVLGTHNFIANGIATHNSIEQDADVVILLHRDDYYDKESPRAGEADFIVAKHRNGPTDTVTVAAQLHLSRFVDMAIV